MSNLQEHLGGDLRSTLSWAIYAIRLMLEGDLSEQHRLVNLANMLKRLRGDIEEAHNSMTSYSVLPHGLYITTIQHLLGVASIGWEDWAIELCLLDLHHLIEELCIMSRCDKRSAEMMRPLIGSMRVELELWFEQDLTKPPNKIIAP